jgi:threonine dehydrogenase-like Zn-dependent dehydrogenase
VIAAQLKAPHEISLVKTEIPTPGSGQVLIRIEGCGICGSNIDPWEGRAQLQWPLAPGEPGHEAWGIVESCGGSEEFTRGERVSMVSYRSFAQFDLAKADHVVRIPDRFSGKPFPGEALASAMNVFCRANIKSGQKVVILGAGFLGLLLTQLSICAGAHVCVVSRRSFALDTARDLGAVACFPSSDPDLTARIIAFCGGDGCEKVIEATGKQESLNLASEVVGTYGTLVIAGYHRDGARTVDVQKWNWKGITVINAHERDPLRIMNGMRMAVEAAEKDLVDPFPLIGHRFDLTDISSGFRAAVERPEGFVKGWVQMC